MFKFLCAVLLLFSPFALAHGGHEHDSKMLTAPKGGVLKSSENMHFELLQGKDSLRIYLYDGELKPQDPKTMTATAEARPPKQKVQTLKVDTLEDHWEIQNTPKEVHRYELEFKVEKDGVHWSVKWNVEPKS